MTTTIQGEYEEASTSQPRTSSPIHNIPALDFSISTSSESNEKSYSQYDPINITLEDFEIVNESQT